MTERINARLDPELARKLEYLRQRTGRSTTGVVKASIEAYYERLAGAERPFERLQDLIGCARGPSDLSATYKRVLSDSLARKARR